MSEPDLENLLHLTERAQLSLLQHLRALVEIESPSDDSAAVNRAGEFVADLASSLGGLPKRHRQREFGDVLELQFGADRKSQPRSQWNSQSRPQPKPLLLLGHLDTVWPVGTLRAMPWREADGRLWGPGVLDMKAGVMMALTAVKVLCEAGALRPVTLLLNSDEEVGSPVSRSITEPLAREAQAVFVLEPAQGLAYKTARKGVGEYRLRVTGVASHSGVDFARGHSAIRELARLVETVSGFTDPARNRTVNCGVIGGGTRSNVVAAEAFADVDVRIAKASDAARVDRLFRTLKVADPGCRLEVTGGINRPPMERTPATVALFRRAKRLAAGLGFPLEEASTGGGSDGNFTSALGVPTLDGMGAVGEGAHAAHESILIEHLAPRTALLAAMIFSV